MSQNLTLAEQIENAVKRKIDENKKREQEWNVLWEYVCAMKDEDIEKCLAQHYIQRVGVQ